MKKNWIISICLFCALSTSAQNNDPILLYVDNKPITRSEFEYSYNKNSGIDGAVEQKSIDEYIDMFINYKLKVVAAEKAKMDTLSSFKKEFTTYRNMQLTPLLVDNQFIDSIAYSIYNRTATQLDGKDLLKPAHILIQVSPNATDAEQSKAKSKIDSLHQAILAGADFAELAKKFSQDPGSARNGGQLPWIGPGSTLKEFEDMAYSLNVNEISIPFKTAVGWHIIKQNERKQFEPYDVLKPQIIESLKAQGIEEISAENKIKKLIEASNGVKTKEEIMDSVLHVALEQTPELKHLIQEYYDGLLLYEISKKEVWDVAANDEKGLESYYKSNKKKYAWTEPRFKGFVYHSKDKKLGKAIKSTLKKNANGEWKKAIKENFNKKESVVLVSGPYLCKAGENQYVDELIFKKGTAKAKEKYPYYGVEGKKLKKPQSWKDVKSLVVNDYQETLEKIWVESLRNTYTFSVDKEIAKTINKH